MGHITTVTDKTMTLAFRLYHSNAEGFRSVTISRPGGWKNHCQVLNSGAAIEVVGQMENLDTIQATNSTLFPTVPATSTPPLLHDEPRYGIAVPRPLPNRVRDPNLQGGLLPLRHRFRKETRGLAPQDCHPKSPPVSDDDVVVATPIKRKVGRSQKVTNTRDPIADPKGKRKVIELDEEETEEEEYVRRPFCYDD
ncbi:hypothetical protein DFS34DRAFT_692669 [Phlyctochytrium arcticum]|nr:hypothetical protein DFS34DRAFT_692669 [Phlyctochytrium arcticum]